MYWKLFEQLYDAYSKRKAVEKVNNLKEIMIGALWSNSNYDDDKGSRQQAITNIENSFDNAIREIYGEETSSQIDWENDPFFAASRSPRIGYDYGVPSQEDREKEERRKESLSELDQF